MIYILYDLPRNAEDMSFLTAAFEKDYEEVHPENPCLSIRQMLSACSPVVKKAKAGDTIVCWYDFMGVLCWWLAHLENKRIKILAINLLLKDKNTAKNKAAKFLYKRALRSGSFSTTVTAQAYGDYINKILGTKARFTLLHDVYRPGYRVDRSIPAEDNAVFCGGRNGRDWKLLFDIARELPDVRFYCVMPHALKEQFEPAAGKNVMIMADLPIKEFLELLCRSRLLVMPLDTEAPAGLSVFFQAAANDKMILTSDTVTTEGYLSNGRGALCSNHVEDWKNKILYYLQHEEEAAATAQKFRSFLEDECSEEEYAKTLWGMLAE